MSRMRTLTPHELPSAADTLARAFEADPMFVFLLPREGTRLAWVRVVMAGLLAMSGPDGLVFTEEGDGLPGVLSMTAPGRYPHPMTRLAGYMARPSTWSKAGFPSPRFLGGVLRLLGAMDKVHIKEPHWYVHIVGVDPPRQGTGLGRGLLAHGLAMTDADGLPAYLETSNPKNLPFYGRFGFEVIDEVRLSGGYPPLWAMRRPARGRA
jgi:GNAT superfamily N-acetyltransferase